MSGGQYRVKRVAGGYCVIDPDGEQVTAPISCKSHVEDSCAAHQRRHDRANRGRKRPCMCCRQEFMSEGNHNRLCDECRRKPSANEAALGPSLKAARAGHR